MEPLNIGALADGALVLVDTPPIIYLLEGHQRLLARFRPLFDRHAEGRIRFAVTTVTIAEVLTGPLAHGNEPLAQRYRRVLESWQVVPLDSAIAEGAARLRASLRLKLPDAIQVASALAIGADALATHDRDFSKVSSLAVLA